MKGKLFITLGLIAVTAFCFFMYTRFEKNIPLLTSDEDLYKVLKEPLIATIIHNGTTLHPDGDKGQLFSYTFNGYMTNAPYRITLSKNVSFEDCAGCIGDWKEGMFSRPEYDTSFISLKEFIIQMVHANDENKTGTGDMIWHTHGISWKVTSTKEGYSIEAISIGDFNKKWIVNCNQ